MGSTIVLVKKRDGGLRLCVNCLQLNGVSVSDAYPMLRIDDIIDQLGKAYFITTLDLTRRYWQVPVADGDRAKTAFIAQFGLFQFKCVPFGVLAIFQRLMDWLVQGLNEFSAAYIDDLVIFSVIHGRIIFNISGRFYRD